MDDDEFWHRLALGRLLIMMGADDQKREDDRDLKLLELNGF
jgi:hypothetical protein